MTPSPTDFKTAIASLWADGLHDQARQMEADAKKRNLYVGSVHTETYLDKLITSDPHMVSLKDDIRILEYQSDPVLIRGETGTGKELIAQALHGSRSGRFVAVNCPALSVDLMLSEFFGHVKGAFTGAVSDRIGKFQNAALGTLFIDEVGDMPLSMQAALLRVLQEKVITRVGANEETSVNTRIVCATNKPLEKLVESGEFRLDLLQRLNTFEIHTTPLRLRRDDIGLIIKKWESLDASHRTGKFPVEVLDTAILPGNVRELWGIYRRWKVLKKL